MTDPVPPALQPSLGRRIMRAGSWSMLRVFGTHGMRLLSNLIMTRLLLPEAFGLMAMVGVLMAGFALFTDIGIGRSIAREPDGDQDRFLRVAWMVKLGRGAIIAIGVLVSALILLFLGPSLSNGTSVYADPRLPALVGLSALAPLIQGAESTRRELADRRLQMHYNTGLDLIAQALTFVAMVTFAYFSPTVWALMAGMIVGAVLRCAGTHLFFPGPRMAFVWDRDIAERLWQYGKWLMGSSIFNFVASNADKFIMGALLNAATFGIYVIAQIWISAGNMIIQSLTSHVGFPAISEVIRNRPDEVRRLYRKFQNVIDAICMTAFVFFLFGGQLMIDLLYTETYAAAGRYLAILSVGLLAMRFNPLNGLIMNMGNSRATMIVSAIRAITIWIALPATYSYLGMSAALLVVAINPLITAPYTLCLTRPILGKAQTRLDWLWFAGTLLIAACVYSLI